jgi:hypothetical protein
MVVNCVWLCTQSTTGQFDIDVTWLIGQVQTTADSPEACVNETRQLVA